VCLAYLSVPVFSFSIPKAGDYIDSSVAKLRGEPATPHSYHQKKNRSTSTGTSRAKSTMPSAVL